MAFIDSHTFGGFDASDGVTYFPAHVAFAEPVRTEAYRRHLAAGNEERTFTGVKYICDPGPTHALSVTVVATSVAALEAAVATLRAAVVPTVRWAFLAAGGAQRVSQVVKNVESDAEGYLPSPDGRFQTLVSFSIETRPGWRLDTSTIATLTDVQIPGTVAITGVLGDMDAETNMRLLPEQATTFIGAAVKSGVNPTLAQNYGSDTTYSAAWGGHSAKSSTLSATMAAVGTADALSANDVRGRYEMFARLLQSDSTPADTTYKARSAVVLTDPSDTVTRDSLATAATKTAAQGYEVLDLGAVMLPSANVPGLTSGEVYGAEALHESKTNGTTEVAGPGQIDCGNITLSSPGLVSFEFELANTSGIDDALLIVIDDVATGQIAYPFVVVIPASTGFTFRRALYTPNWFVNRWSGGEQYVYMPAGDWRIRFYDGNASIKFKRTSTTPGINHKTYLRQLVTFGATAPVIAANSGGGNAYLDYTVLMPTDEGYLLSRNAFAANQGVMCYSESGEVMLATATGVGASLLYRSASVNTDRIGRVRLRPGDNALWFVAGTPADAAPGVVNGTVEYWPMFALPPGV